MGLDDLLAAADDERKRRDEEGTQLVADPTTGATVVVPPVKLDWSDPPAPVLTEAQLDQPQHYTATQIIEDTLIAALIVWLNKHDISFADEEDFRDPEQVLGQFIQVRRHV